MELRRLFGIAARGDRLAAVADLDLPPVADADELVVALPRGRADRRRRGDLGPLGRHRLVGCGALHRRDPRPLVDDLTPARAGRVEGEAERQAEAERQHAEVVLEVVDDVANADVARPGEDVAANGVAVGCSPQAIQPTTIATGMNP